MNRGNANGNNRGGGRGFRGGDRGGPQGRSRGRGGGRARGRGRGGPRYDISTELDFMVQMYPEQQQQQQANRGGYGSPGNRGRGIGSPVRGGGGYDSPSRGRGRGRGGTDNNFDSRGGRGRGRGGPKLRPDAPLSKLLYGERPLLRPIKFVRSVHHAMLFQEEEELLQPVVEDVGDEEASHVPTADRVARVFSGGHIPRIESDTNNEDEGSESLEEIDFEDLGKLRQEVDNAAAALPGADSAIDATVPLALVEERFTGIFIHKKPDSTPDGSMPDLSSDNDALPVRVVESKAAETAIGILDTAMEPSVQLSADAPEPALAIASEATLTVTESVPASTSITDDIAVDPAAPTTDLSYVDTTPAPVPIAVTVSEPTATEPLAVPTPLADAAPLSAPPPDLFYVDTTPTPLARTPGAVEAALAPLRAYPMDDDEVIVYVAPHPRAGLSPSRVGSGVALATLASTSSSTAAPAASSSTAPAAAAFTTLSFASPASSPKKPRRQPPAFTPRAHAKAQTKARVLARRVARRAAGASSFSAFGARAAERRLQGEDPRREERRRGDSDLEWGSDEDGDEDEEEEEGGMDVDSDLDALAMARFARGMGPEGGRWVTMDDVRDEERMRAEDEDGGGGEGSSASESDGEDEDDDEVEAIVDAEEALMIAEPRDLSEDKSDDEEDEDEDSDEDSDDDDDDDPNQSPKSGFQARLERLRKAARERGPDDSLELMELEFSDEEDDYDEFLDRNRNRNRTWAERDEDFAAEIQAILDDNGDILSSRSRQGRKKLLKAVASGEIVEFDGFAAPAKRGKNKRNDLPEELQAVWDRDRAKKAENKRLRALARMEAAADPLVRKKGGKKGRKAMLAAARIDPTITPLPNRVVDLPTLVQQIRRFVGDIGGPQTMALPPAEKETRKSMHELAIAFGLKSQSKGKGEGRYTTLAKTTRSGIRVDEAKVAKILRRGGGGGGASFVRYGDGGKGRGGGASIPRHRDGDEVGKAAPKIGETNVGFKMLALMGWAEGERIGASADGLHVPLTAVIKNTKLGLGATR